MCVLSGPGVGPSVLDSTSSVTNKSFSLKKVRDGIKESVQGNVNVLCLTGGTKRRTDHLQSVGRMTRVNKTFYLHGNSFSDRARP